MIVVYNRTDNRLLRGGPEVLTPDALWIDLLSPSTEEEHAVEALLGFDVPTHEEMKEIELSRRLSREDGILTMTAPVVANSTGINPETGPLTFILTADRLLTVRYSSPQTLINFQARLERVRPTLVGPEEMVLDLLDAFVERLADVLERVALDQDNISHRIFHHPTPFRHRRRTSPRELEVILRTIGRGGDLQSRARDSITGLRRVGAFLASDQRLLATKNGSARMAVIASDLQSLSEYADSLSVKISFLLDATLGMINIQQNNIIKLFSVMAVLLMPPTLVASIYGMNFRHMPELEFVWGYPAALGLMLVAAILPYWLFKRKGWM